MIKKIILALFVAVISFFSISAFADSNLYFDLSALSDYSSITDSNSEKLSITYLPKNGNIITKTDSSLYFSRTTDNSIDCFTELIMPDRFLDEKTFVLDFVFEPVKINTTLRIFRANGTISGASYDFVAIHSGTDTPARLKVTGKDGYINLPEGDTRISLCIDLTQKLADIYVGDIVIYDVALDIIDNLNIRTFWIGTNSGGGDTEFYAKDVRIYSGTAPADTSDYTFIRPSVMDKNDGTIKAKKLLGDSMAFTESVFYHNSQKLNPEEEFGSAPYMQGDVLMIPREASRLCLGERINSVYDKIIFSFGTAYTGDMFYTKNDGTTVPLSSPIVISGNNIFVPLVDMCKALGFNYYADERGFVVVNKNTTLEFSNSPVTYYNSENSDVVYRYLHFDRPSGKDIVSKIMSLYDDKPAFLANTSRLNTVVDNINSDLTCASMADYTISQADALLDLPCVEYKFQDSLRILDSCQSVKSRMQTLCAAYLISDVGTRDKYAAKIWAELQNCLNWPDWNTHKHFLDSGMLAPGVAIAYDTLTEYLNDTQKAWVRERVHKLYLEFCIKAYQGTYSGSEFRYSTSNWGAVCSGGILSICLAFAPDATGDFRTDIEYLIENAMHSLEFPATMLYPDGAWYEGVGYGGYVGEFLTSYCIAPLVNYSGSDYGFLTVPGYMGLYEFPISVFGPAGIFNYSDNAWSGKPYYNAYTYQAALLAGDRYAMSIQKNHRNISGSGTSALNVLWYEPSMYTDGIYMPRDIHYSGAGITVSRRAFDKSSSSFVAIKSGINSTYGSHFDKGSFVFDLLGVRWAMDLGFDNYNVEGGYHGESGFTLYRKRTEGHNCVVINPTSDSPGQILEANTYLEKSDCSDGSSYMIYNLTDAYSDNADEYKRGFYLGDGREILTVRDEISLKGESDIYWFMHTEAEIVIDDNKKGATLYKDGRQLRVTADCNLDGWYFEIRDAQPFDESMIREGEYLREGITKLTLVAKGSGEVTITVKLSQGGIDGFSPLPLSAWQCESDYNDPPFSDVTWSGGKIKLEINNDFPYKNAIIATYSDSSLQSVETVDVTSIGQYEISDSIHTKIFFWDDFVPVYRYYEFSTERK